MTAMKAMSAGRSRRARRFQNRSRSMLPVFAYSFSISPVMRKPLMTKKTSTPR